MQISTLLSIKTGGCPEDCAYCPQAARYDTGVRAEKLMALNAVLDEARAAKDRGASRFCMGAAWREPKDRDLDQVCAMVEGVKGLGLETCATLGMLTGKQALRLKQSGLDYYNHNLDTSPEFYGEVISTRTYGERLDTLGHVRAAGINVCCGGIVGMGESAADRAGLIATLASLPAHPESVPINMLVKVEGTPLGAAAALDALDFVRTIAVARVTMPRSVVRLSAGREEMSDETQALCFLMRRQFDLLWRAAPHHAQPGRRPRPRADGPPGARADAGSGLISRPLCSRAGEIPPPLEAVNRAPI